MSTNVDGLVANIREWSNRGTDVLSDSIIKQCIRWAIDKTCRELRIAPMESTAVFTGTGNLSTQIKSEPALLNGRTVSSIEIPSRLIEVIALSAVDTAGGTQRMFDVKADERTFFGPNAEWYSSNVWARKGGRFYLSTAFPHGTETSIELHYYARPLDIDAAYSVTADNFDSAQTYLELMADQTGSAGTNQGFLNIKTSGSQNVTDINAVLVATNDAQNTSAVAANAAAGIYKFSAKSPSNWFVDENERIALYGALTEIFAFLQEDDQVQKYDALMQRELASLHKEEQMRQASGGNVQINFNGRGLI
jgi:hypothetical protein